MPLVFVDLSLGVPSRGRACRPRLGMEHNLFFGEADRRIASVVERLVERQHVFHRRRVFAAQQLGEARDWRYSTMSRYRSAT